MITKHKEKTLYLKWEQSEEHINGVLTPATHAGQEFIYKHLTGGYEPTPLEWRNEIMYAAKLHGWGVEIEDNPNYTVVDENTKPVRQITKDEVGTLKHFAHMCSKATDEQLDQWAASYAESQPLFVEIIERELKERENKHEHIRQARNHRR